MYNSLLIFVQTAFYDFWSVLETCTKASVLHYQSCSLKAVTLLLICQWELLQLQPDDLHYILFNYSSCLNIVRAFPWKAEEAYLPEACLYFSLNLVLAVSLFLWRFACRGNLTADALDWLCLALGISELRLYSSSGAFPSAACKNLAGEGLWDTQMRKA